ncbi:hypothetical protein BKA70DRAFT_467110 [Coprinopsis sp. MPI-PUGE-AT-0042]|nr:hypothetical protein BKA70DRAFT_467110 [Coprinopsis sp. MPI-PUGE-AT-0042]
MPFPSRGNFNFVFRGIASIAATVASPFTRKRDSLTPAPEGLSAVPSHFAPDLGGATTARPPLQQHASLKRKAPDDGFDERTTDDNAYPNNLRNIYSPKRSRTPTKTPQQQANKPPSVVEIAQQAPPHTEPTSALTDVTSEIAAPDAAGSADSEMDEVPPPPIAPPAPQSLPVAPVAEPVVSSDVPSANIPAETSSAPAASTPPSTPAPAFTPKAFSSNSGSSFASPGFAAFAGSASPFASVKKTSDKKFRASLWAVDSDASPSNEGSAFKNSLGSAFGEPDVQASVEPDIHAISAAKPAQVAQQPSTCPTGEEGEDLEQEVKGVKLFVKRGNKPFASGMVGHLKLLSDRATQAERLLFRREPLWQVSMNVRVNPATRCVYDPEESVIRLTLKERTPSAKPEDKESTELVIYALKPGRGCSKQDFKDFAESLAGNALFKQASTAQ